MNVSIFYNMGSINVNWKLVGIIGRVNLNSMVMIMECYNFGIIILNLN